MSDAAQRPRPPDDITPADFFLDWLPETVHGDPERRAQLGRTRATLLFELTGAGGGSFTVHLDEGSVRGQKGRPGDPDLRIEVDVTTWRRLNRGDITAPEAALRRRVKLSGDLLLALKLHVILG